MARRHQSSRPVCRMSVPTSFIFSTRTTPGPVNDMNSESVLCILKSTSASPVEWSASVQEAHLSDLIPYAYVLTFSSFPSTASTPG
ncbi:uncharacterized protein PHACADRAFT_253834 [Phanerochaete carnosa HHB-10118-sp]|uniref:Uncharacterized protein n=1 Tax=Phanerochaete carnosa (strain HHB-10118-sp) TaxID=650164 RepID=K5V267_PHACS|nr:uncharacterized protein PHACADRAFT_253834 [Phanerochaete carnosa HHB-10118-sp]EKM56621.1 hypothetical protein PHACADRAFT_253834 [Phanerochaete carnosa HHB-10118-sp]